MATDARTMILGVLDNLLYERNEALGKVIELEAKLAALDWTEITESNLPKLGDEVGRQNSSGIWLAYTVETNADYRFWHALGYTHFRPINPPVQP